MDIFNKVSPEIIVEFVSYSKLKDYIIIIAIFVIIILVYILILFIFICMLSF